MGLVVSSAVAAGPLVIDHLEVPLNLHEKKGKRKKDNKKFELKNRVSEKQIKVQENKFHNKETHSKSKENISKVNENAITVQNKKDSRGISALNSRPSSRSSFGSPIKKNKIKFAQYNPVEKYLTSYIGKHETDSKENKDMRLQPGPDDSLGDKDTLINQNTLQESSNTENEAIQMNTGINTPSTNMTNEVRLKECEKKLDIKDYSKNEEMGRTNNETDLENTSHETPETLTASEPKGMAAIAQAVDNTLSNIFNQIDSALDKKKLDKTIVEIKPTIEDLPNLKTAETFTDQISNVKNEKENQHWSKIKYARLTKGSPQQQNGNQPQTDLVRFASAKSESEKSSKGSFLESLDEELKIEINKKYGGYLNGDSGSRVSTATGRRQGKTRRIIMDSYKSLPPDRREEFEIYAQNILRHSRVGFKPRSNRGTRVIHQQDWQT